MAEAFVDVTYRGLELGKGLKLRDVKPEHAYLEVPLPMPVGTKLSIDAGEGVHIEAFVIAVHEQVGGSDQIPGMKVRPTLAGKSLAWWNQRCDGVAVETPTETAAPVEEIKEEASRSKKNGRRNGKRNTVPPPSEPEPVSPAIVAALAAEAAQNEVVDDGRSTETMAAVDPVALGLSMDDDGAAGRTAVMSSVDMEALAAAGDDAHGDDDDVEVTIEAEDQSPSASGSMPAQGGKKKKRRKKR